MRSDFVHLHCHSKFSVNDALCSVIDLAKKTKEFGMPAIALTDHGRIGGAVAFSNACYDEKIEGIVGCEIYICDGDMQVKESIMRDGKKRRPKHYHATVLCKNEQGYKNLVEICNIGTNLGYYYEPRVDLKTIEQHLDGLVVTAGCMSGMIPQAIIRDEWKRYEQLLDWWHSRLGEDFYLEIHKHAANPFDERSQQLHDNEDKIQIKLTSEAEKRGINIIAANDVHYIRQGDKSAHDILKALRSNNSENTGQGYPTDQFYLKTADEMYDLFSEIPEACSNTIEVAEKCQYRYPTKTTWQYPGFEIPESDKFQAWKSKHMPHYTDKQAFLKYLCVGSLRKKDLLNNTEYTERTKYELQKIYEMGFEEYFLILWDIFYFCRKNNIACGPGRGSGAGSLVLYLTGITLIDPLDPELGLMFERFLNPGRSSQYKLEFSDYSIEHWKEERGDAESSGKLRIIVEEMMNSQEYCQYTPELIREILPLENQKLDDYYLYLRDQNFQASGNPVNSWIAYCLGIVEDKPTGPLTVSKMGSLPDVDSDFDHKYREKVIEYIKDKYGEDHVVNIGTYGEFGAKSTLIGTLKFYGMDHQIAQECSNAIPRGVGITLRDALETSKFKKTLSDHNVPREAIRNALKIEGAAYSCVSGHASGVVIAPEPLTDKIPMHRAKDYIVTQFDMGDIEIAGYIKFDFLGLSNVGKMARCLENIAKIEDWKNVTHNDFFMAIDRNDPEALDVFRRGQTATIFQFASSGIRQALEEVQVDNFRDLVAIAALYRPGPMAYISKSMYENNVDLEGNEPWKPGMTYAENKKNPKTIKYLHPDLEPILKETYGIIVYQEEVMKIAQVIGGFTLQEADVLRKAIGKKIGELFEWCHSKFIKGGLEKGYNKSLLDEIWKAAENFASYSFNKSHSTAYAMIALWNAYLLAYYPGEWYAASISEDITKKTTKKENKSDVYINEAKENGIKIEQPDVNRSMEDATVDYHSVNTTIILPLSYVKGIGRKSIEIVSYPIVKGKRFKDCTDFVVKCNPTKTVFCALMGIEQIEDITDQQYSLYEDSKNTGAFRSFGLSGTDLVMQYMAGKRILAGQKKLDKMQENYADCISSLFG